MNKVKPSLSDVPIEVMINDMIPNLSTDDLSSLCSTDLRLLNLCRQESFWERLSMIKYSKYINQKPINMTWRQFYMTIIPINTPSLEMADRVRKELIRRAGLHIMEPNKAYVQLETEPTEAYFAKSIEEVMLKMEQLDPTLLTHTLDYLFKGLDENFMFVESLTSTFVDFVVDSDNIVEYVFAGDIPLNI